MKDINKAEDSHNVSCPRLPHIFYSALCELQATGAAQDMNWTSICKDDPRSAEYYDGDTTTTPPRSK